MSQQIRSLLTLLVVGIECDSALRKFTDALTTHNIEIHYQSTDQRPDTPNIVDLANCNLVLFRLENTVPDQITELWSEARLPAVALTDTTDPFEHDEAIFAVLSPSADPAHAANILAIAAARGRQSANSIKRLAQLERTLDGRRVVEQAKWKLIEERGLSEPEAHILLQKTARGQRIPLPEVAQNLLNGGELA